MSNAGTTMEQNKAGRKYDCKRLTLYPTQNRDTKHELEYAPMTHILMKMSRIQRTG